MAALPKVNYYYLPNLCKAASGMLHMLSEISWNFKAFQEISDSMCSIPDAALQRLGK